MSDKKLENAKQIRSCLKMAECHLTSVNDTEHNQKENLMMGVAHLLTALSIHLRSDVEEDIEMWERAAPEDEKPT